MGTESSVPYIEAPSEGTPDFMGKVLFDSKDPSRINQTIKLWMRYNHLEIEYGDHKMKTIPYKIIYGWSPSLDASNNHILPASHWIFTYKSGYKHNHDDLIYPTRRVEININPDYGSGLNATCKIT